MSNAKLRALNKSQKIILDIKAEMYEKHKDMVTKFFSQSDQNEYRTGGDDERRQLTEMYLSGYPEYLEEIIVDLVEELNTVLLENEQMKDRLINQSK